MNINDLVTHYVTFRRTLGERCKTNESILRSFCRSVGPRTPVAAIGADAVAAFLAGAGPVTSAWHIKYHALKGFFRFAVSRGHLNEAPLPTVLPKRPPPFVPYIYSRDEIRRLLDAIPSYRRCRTGIEPETLRAILLLLYGAGLRAREALNLSVADVDLPNAILTVRDTKFFKSRLVPIEPAPDECLDRVCSMASGDPPGGGRRRAVSSSASVGPRFTWTRWRMPSSDSGSTPRSAVPMTPATSLGCTTCGTRSRSTG